MALLVIDPEQRREPVRLLGIQQRVKKTCPKTYGPSYRKPKFYVNVCFKSIVGHRCFKFKKINASFFFTVGKFTIGSRNLYFVHRILY